MGTGKFVHIGVARLNRNAVKPGVMNIITVGYSFVVDW